MTTVLFAAASMTTGSFAESMSKVLFAAASMTTILFAAASMTTVLFAAASMSTGSFAERMSTVLFAAASMTTVLFVNDGVCFQFLLSDYLISNSLFLTSEMAVPEVDKNMLGELEEMGFPTARAIRALHYSGNASLEAAINWIVEHENDSDIDQMPFVCVNIVVEGPNPSLISEKMKIKAQELRERARKMKEEEENKMERQIEKERIRVGKDLLEAKQIEEENERKRFNFPHSILAFRKAEKDEEKRAREKIRQKLEADKAERRRKLGLPLEDRAAVKPTSVVQEKESLLPVKPATKAERMRDCLRSLKQNHKGDDARVKRAFQTLLTYVGNVAKNPNEEKFRKIRVNNPAFQDRVGNLEGGIEFLELCGFERIEGGRFLFLPRDNVDMEVLNSAGSELNSAIANPFFGIL
ncbi:hypothetical protein HHK36_020271 [Tetracentron sinense]|uniref:UBA domain-containing protein n=1 Tax=Tetracentron sinense TaxID=13715 RepID=A0A835DAT2_TETSI|nr:hypothetical protein HHK36_020271 [Tetracentron sinense]